MSAILSADDLNDFISPGIACIKPVESLPPPPSPTNPYEVTTEDSSTRSAPAQISLTDCLACSGCVTSAEAVLVQLQSVQEVVENLRSPRGRTFVALVSPQSVASLAAAFGVRWGESRAMVERALRGAGFAAVVDTDVGRDIAAVYAFEEVMGGGGALVNSVGRKKPILTSACPGFICYAEAVHPYLISHLSQLKSPQAILGTLVKSVLPKVIARERGVPEEQAGPGDVYVIGVQPCFDKKLEGARGELTSAAWEDGSGEEGMGEEKGTSIRDVDCVITTRELVKLAEEFGIEYGKLQRTMPSPSLWLREEGQGKREDALVVLLRMAWPEEFKYTPSPLPISSTSSSANLAYTLQDKITSPSIVPPTPTDHNNPSLITGTSGGYLHYILLRLQYQHPGSTITVTRGRNSDTVEYALLYPATATSPPTEIIKLARSYGFRNIQNLVRKLKPQKRRVLPRFGKKGAGGQVVLGGRKDKMGDGGTGYAYVEVMACPGGCTNGGGQVKVEDELVTTMRVNEGDKVISVSNGAQVGENGTAGGVGVVVTGVSSQQKQREWLAKVDEAYWSDESSTTVISSANPSTTSSLNIGDAMEIDAGVTEGTNKNNNIDRSSPLLHQHHHHQTTTTTTTTTTHLFNTDPTKIHHFVDSWSRLTAIPVDKLLFTTYRKVEDDFNRAKRLDDDAKEEEEEGEKKGEEVTPTPGGTGLAQPAVAGLKLGGEERNNEEEEEKKGKNKKKVITKTHAMRAAELAGKAGGGW